MESTSDTHKVSDSGYSNSCSNSQSQRSGSSNSRKSGSHSSRSSGYCGHPSTATNSSEAAPQPISKRNKDGEHKKKKLKSTSANITCQTTTDTSDVLKQTKTLIEDNNTGNDNTNNDSSVPNVTSKSFTVLGSPNIIPVKEDEGGVLSQKTPLPSPKTPKLAESAQIDDVILPKRDAETISEKHYDERMEIIEGIIESATPETPAKAITCQPEDGFCCVISMHDGVVLYTTPSLTAVLGFPKDMWLGRSFIEFIHQKDREVFASQITNGLAAPLVDSGKESKDIKNTVFVNLRKYRGLKSSGYGVVENATIYQPFQLTIRVRQVNGPNDPKYIDDTQGMFLVVVAVPVHSAYKVSNETCKMAKFSTRHTSSCIISHVDPDVVTNFGFFPQDMIGSSILDFYHPEDMPLIKEVYETVIVKCKTAGTVFRSQPYRFAVQNGGYATVETEWTSFVNPWTRKLEFVIGYHKILQGPINPNVFSLKENGLDQLTENVLKESISIKTDILDILNQLIQIDSVKQQVTQRCKDLANFMETLLDDVSKCSLKLDLSHEANVSVSNVSKNNIDGILSQIQERDSVMLGEISPHHEYFDSKSSTETPPSYNQLNYNENIQRFFMSKPMTTLSDELHGQFFTTTDTDQEGKTSTLVQECSSQQKCLSPVHCSGTSGSGSGGNLSSESNPQIDNSTASGTNFSGDSYKPPHLTEALLLKHNAEMEKIMMKRHKDQRLINKADKKFHYKNHVANMINSEKYNQGNHGVKRSGSHSWDVDNHKVSKHQHQSESKNIQDNNYQNTNNNNNINRENNNRENNNLVNNISNNILNPTENVFLQSGVDNVNLWPPFSVTVTPIHTTQPCTTNILNNAGTGYSTGMFPAMYYISTHTGQSPGEYPGPPTTTVSSASGPSAYHLQYMPSMMYSTVFGASPIMCPPVAMLQPVTLPITQQPVTPRTLPTENKDVESQKPNTPTGYNTTLQHNTGHTKAHFQRPASQATSVKAEPSTVGSIASASVNRAMSECSRKDIGLQSVCSPDSPMVSPQDGDMIIENYNKAAKHRKIMEQENPTTREVNIGGSTGDEESSYSSFYSSFLKTDTGSGSNEDNNNPEIKQNDKETNWKKPKGYPMRKLDPPWLDNIKVTPELTFRYQLDLREIGDVLDSDLNSLKDIDQPDLVNEQLSQLYLEMELEGLSAKLTLEDTNTSSSSSGSNSSGEEHGKGIKPKKKRRSYSELVMIYEEDSPMPPPISNIS